jgi:hypothetical protein
MKPRTLDVLKAIHLLALALWGGGAAFFSFLTTPRIFGYLRDQLPADPPPGLDGLTDELGRRLAGDTVGAIFPTYFVTQIIAGILAGVTGLVFANLGRRLEKVRCGLTIVALAIVSLHAVTVYPRSIRVLDAHYAAQEADDQPGAAELRKVFGMWHGVSQLLNLLTIGLVLAALVLAGVAMRDPMRT